VVGVCFVYKITHPTQSKIRKNKKNKVFSMKEKKKKGYYAQKKAAYIQLEEVIRASGENGAEINKILYEFTMKYSIGERTILKRIQLLKDLNCIFEEEGKVIWRVPFKKQESTPHKLE